VLESKHAMANCPKCGVKLVSFCPGCRGKKGGKVKSKAKTRANRLKGRPRKWPKCKLFRSHRFSIWTGKCRCGFTQPKPTTKELRRAYNKAHPRA